MSSLKATEEGERQQFQAKIYTTWLNSKLVLAPGSPKIEDIFQDLRDGKFLILLLGVITNDKLKAVKGNLPLHHLNNLTLVLDTLQKYKVKLVGISNQSILNGEKVPTLGLCWSIIYRFQVLEALQGDGKAGNAEKALLNWIKDSLEGYNVGDPDSFQSKHWKDGNLFCSLLHAFKPEMFDYETLKKMNDLRRWEFGIDTAHNNYDVNPLFSAEDIHKDAVDSRTLVLYISSVYEKLKDKVPANKLPSVPEIQEEEEEIFAEEAAVDESSQIVVDNLLSSIGNREKEINKQKDSPILKSGKENKGLKDMEKHLYDVIDLEKQVEKLNTDDIKSEFDLATSINNVSESDERKIKDELQNVTDKYNSLMDEVDTEKKRAENQYIGEIMKQLHNINELMDNTKSRKNKFLDQEDTSSAPPEILDSNIKICEDMMSDLRSIQPLMKHLSKMTNDISNDENIESSKKDELKEKQLKTTKDFEELMDSLNEEKEKVSAAKDNYTKHIKDLENNWLENLERIQNWLTATLEKFREKNKQGKPTNEEEATERMNEIKVARTELEENWKNYQELGNEWNTELCDKLQNELYADMLLETKDDFNSLNKELSEQKSRTGKALKEFTDIKILNAWKQLYNPKMEKLKFFSQSIPVNSEDDTFELVKQWNDEIKEVEKEFQQYEERLNELINEKEKVLNDNKKVSSKIKKVMDDDIEHMRALIEKEKKRCNELKLQALKTKEVLASENDKIYKDWFDRYIESSHVIADFSQNIEQLLSQENPDITINQMDELLKTVHEYESSYNDVQDIGSKLSSNNRLSKEKKENILNEKGILENSWSDLLQLGKSLKKRLKAKKAEEDGISNNAITDWKMKMNDMNHSLESNANNEIFSSLIPENLKSLLKFQEEVDKAETKFNNDKKIIDENLEFGQELIDSKKIKDENAVDEIVFQISDIKDRNKAIEEKFLDLKNGLETAKEQLKENEAKKFDEWCDKLTPVTNLINEDNKTCEELLSNDSDAPTISKQLEKMKDNEEVIKETIVHGVLCANDDAFGEEKRLEVEKQCNDLKSNYSDFKLSMESLDKKLEDKKVSVLQEWDSQLQDHQDFIKKQTANLNNIENEDDVNVSLQEIETLSNHIDGKQPSIEEFGEYSENLLKDNLLDDASKKRVNENYKTLLNEWNTLKERNVLLDNRLQKKRMEEEGMSTKLMTEWDERVEKIEELLSDIENDPVFDEKTLTSFDELEKLEKDIKQLEFRFDVESKVVDGHLDFGKYLCDGKTLKNGNTQDKIKSQIDEYESRRNNCKENIEKLYDNLKTHEMELVNNQEHLLSDWHGKIEKPINSSDDIHEEIASDLASPDNIDSKKLKELQEQTENLIDQINDCIREGKSLEDCNNLNKEGKEQVEMDLKKLKDKIAELEDAQKLLKEKKDEMQTSVCDAWLNDLSVLQEFVKDKNSLLNHINMRDDLDDIFQQFKDLSEEIESKESDIEKLEKEKDSLVNDSDLLDEKSKNALDNDYKTFLKDWNELKERLEVANNRILELQMEEEGASNEILKEWASKAEHIEDWLYQAENEPLLEAEIPDDFYELDSLEQKEQNLSFQLRTEEKVIDEKLEFGENLSRSNKIKDPTKKDELKSQLAEFNRRKKALAKSIKDLEDKCLSKRESLGKIGEQIYDEWKNTSNDLNEQLENENDKAKELLEKIKNEEIEGSEEEVSNKVKNHIMKSEDLQKNVKKHLDEGNRLASSNKLPNDLKKKIKEDCYIESDNAKALQDSNATLQNWLNNNASSTVGKWHELLAFLQSFVREKSNQMNTVDLNKDSEKALEFIKELSKEIDRKEDTVEKLQAYAESITDPNSTIEDSAKLSVETSCNSFIEDWNALKDRRDAMQLSVETRQAEDMEVSSHSLKEWREKAYNIGTWLETAEQNPIFEKSLPENLQELEKVSSDLENLIFKLTTEEKIIDDQLEFGVNLSNSGKIKNPSHLESLKNELKDFNERKKALNDSLLKLSNRVSEELKNAQNNENDLFNKWMDDADVVKKKLDEFEETGKEVVIKTSKDAESIIEKQKIYCQELEDYEVVIEGLVDEGNSLIEQKKLGGRKSQDVQSEIRILEQRWSALNKQAGVLQERYSDIAAMLNSESDEKADNLLKRIQLFREWLDLGLQQLEFYQNSGDSVPFNELMQREQGLMKLSTDLESRAKEFNDLQRGADHLKGENEEVKGKNKDVADEMELLENQWSDIIDGIDKELKDLYDKVNNSLDKTRGELDNSLKKIENELEEILNEDVNADSIIDQTKKLGGISSELSNHASTIKKFSSQTNAVGDVTLFKDSEKDLMKQSYDDVAARYKRCESLHQIANQRLREHIMEYFKSRCDMARENINKLRDEKINEDEDEENVKILRDYLKQYQDLLANAKVEEYNMEDVEKFAEKVSLLGLLNTDDQMKVAQNINNTLKSIEDLKQDCRAKMNRIYAVLVHSLKVRQQYASQQLQEFEKDIAECGDTESFQTFKDAINKYNKLKDLETRLNSTIENIDEIKIETGLVKDAKVLDSSDVEKLSSRTSDLLQDSMTSSESLGICKKRFFNAFRALTLRKLDEFWGWLPIMQKRSSEGNEIGPDLFAVKKQLQEMQVISSQTQDKSFELLLKDENKDIFKQLPEEERNEMENANKEWQLIDEWQKERTGKLEQANSLWEEFNQNESDLLDYLRDNEKEEKAWSQLDLNDPESVGYCRSVFSGVMEGLEMRKAHVERLENTCDEILKFLSGDAPVADNVRSRVADIHDAWNKTVKKSIESSSKLRKSCDLLEKLEQGVTDLRTWINETNKSVEDFNENKNNERVAKLRETIQVQADEKKSMRELLTHLNTWNDDLNNDEITRSHFSLNDDLTALSYDFDDAVKLLEYFDTFRGKGFVLWRRVKQSVGDGATKTKQMFEPSEELPPEQTAEGVLVEDKTNHTTNTDGNKNS